MLRKLASRVVVWMGVSCLVFGLLAVPAWADGNEREIDAAKKRVQELLHEAEELQDLGRHDEARELVTKAEELQQRINAALKRMKKSKERGPGEKNWEGILRGLGNGIEALVALGKQEEAERLEEIAVGIKRRIERSKKREDEENVRRARAREAGDAERAIVKRRVEVMGMAANALREANRKNELEILERGMHGYELLLEGRRDAEAKKIIGNMPDREQIAEVLIYAGKLWHEFGHPDKGDVCQKTGWAFIGKKKKDGRERREREGRHGKERERERHHEREGRREREHRGSDDLMNRIEQLQERITHLEDMIKKLQHSLQDIKGRR